MAYNQAHLNADCVALFLPMLAGGGAERVMLRLAQSFSELGLRCDLVLATDGGALRDQVPPSVRVVELKAAGVLSALPGLIRYLRQDRPFALLATLDHASIIAIWATRLARAGNRVFVRVTTPISVAMPLSRRRLDRLIPKAARMFYPLADGVIAVSQGVADDLARIAPRTSARTHVIYNPIPFASIQVKAAEPVEHPWLQVAGVPVLIAVGRLIPLKDFSTLLQAFALARKQRPLRLAILGEGDERSKLEALAASLGIADSVALPGFVQNPYAWMRRASTLVLSSRWEGFPNVLLEALACGCPVISTSGPGGAAELLENGRWGRLVPVGDVDAMASAMLDVLDRPLDSVALQQYVQNQFDHRHIAGQYLRLMRGEP